MIFKDSDDETHYFDQTRSEFEKICKRYFDRLEVVINEAVAPLLIARKTIRHIVLAGSSTRFPKVHEILAKCLKADINVIKSKFFGQIKPEEGVINGATLKAAMLGGYHRYEEYEVTTSPFMPVYCNFQESKFLVADVIQNIPSPITKKPFLQVLEHSAQISIEVSFKKVKKMNYKLLFHRSAYHSNPLKSEKFSGALHLQAKKIFQ